MQKMQTKTLANLVRAALKAGIANADAADGLSGHPSKGAQEFDQQPRVDPGCVPTMLSSEPLSRGVVQHPSCVS